jgi:hypothetical protein
MSAMVTSPDPLNELFSALEELLKRIADTDDPEIRRKRARLREQMIAVKTQATPVAPEIGLAELPVGGNFGTGWSRSAWAALAAAAVALSVFRHSS